MPKEPGDKHPETNKPDLCRKVFELLEIDWENSEFASKGGTCKKNAWGTVYDRLTELKEKGHLTID